VVVVCFDRAAAMEDFNRFDAPLCDGSPVACVIDFAAALRLFTLLVFCVFGDLEPDGRRGGVLGDFLRDFLDIRLPFVAFGGSTIRILRPESRIRAGGWASLTAPEYSYKDFDAPPVRSLREPFAPDDEQRN
jgi:hypothetical protein